MSKKNKFRCDCKPRATDDPNNVNYKPSDIQLDTTQTPEFIYGGPFVKVSQEEPFINTTTPYDLEFQGTFKRTFAHYTLTDRLPIIITKLIDLLAREGDQIAGANGSSPDGVKKTIRYLTKLKADLTRNKEFDLLVSDADDVFNWNYYTYIVDINRYFLCNFVFAECYTYRRIKEAFEVGNMPDFDYFAKQKAEALEAAMENACVVATKFMEMLTPNPETRVENFCTLMQLSLWANKCDLSLSLGEKDDKGCVADPFKMAEEAKANILVDMSAVAAERVIARGEELIKALSEPPPPPEEGADEDVEPPTDVYFDIVTDNAGYELFCDMCIAHFVLAQNIATKVRFNLKNMPWFISDAMLHDVTDLVDWCTNAEFAKQVIIPAKTEEGAVPEEGAEEPPGEVVNITSSQLNELGRIWQGFIDEEKFVLLNDDFWTSPWTFDKMATYDPELLDSLRESCGIMFKGDLNYRKVTGEKNWNPTVNYEAMIGTFQPNIQFILRTIKSDGYIGVKGPQLAKLVAADPNWNLKGNYGLILFSGKVEKVKK